jgi:hypothetical protein
MREEIELQTLTPTALSRTGLTQDKRVCRLIDKKLLPILIWVSLTMFFQKQHILTSLDVQVYFLQILDKYLLGLGEPSELSS